jgi:hypothetical protein
VLGRWGEMDELIWGGAGVFGVLARVTAAHFGWSVFSLIRGKRRIGG